jgi:Domain of unknown function (DUF4389)
LIKWLLAFPQYHIVGALVGSSYVVATSMQDGRAVSYSTPSLIGACVLIAAVALLFTTRHPPGLFDLAVGIDRWGYRLLVYIALMTDRYSPFRLNHGSTDIERPPQSPTTGEAWQVEQPPSYGPEAERELAIKLGLEDRLETGSRLPPVAGVMSDSMLRPLKGRSIGATKRIHYRPFDGDR